MSKWRDSINVRTPFFKPVSRRLIFTGVSLGWSLFEFINGSYGFGLIFAVAGGYLLWEFFIVFDPKNYDPPSDDT